MIERVVQVLAEIAVRVIGPNACGDAIARRQYGELGHFAVFVVVDEGDDESDDDDEGELDPGIWGGDWLDGSGGRD